MTGDGGDEPRVEHTVHLNKHGGALALVTYRGEW